MITHCDKCNTYFRVSIEQLQAANGKVKCGSCMHVFNAIESLFETSDTTQEASNLEMGRKLLNAAEKKYLLERAQVPARISNFSDPDEVATPDNSFASDNEHGPEDEAPVSVWNNDEYETVEIPIEEEFSSDDIDDLDDALDDHRHYINEKALSIPQDSIYDKPVQNQSYSIFLWSAASMLFLGALFYQYFQFNSAKLLSDMPNLQGLCRYINCPDNTSTIDTSRIKLLSRDVREHPQLSDVLLVNLTLVSEAKVKQAFPRLQLDFFDSYGRPIGSRRFDPGEYLDDSVEIKPGMKPDQPVHVVLEIVGTSAAASSFEFTFL